MAHRPADLPRWLAPLVLAGLVALLFAEVLFRGQALFQRDINGMIPGQHATLVRCLQLGSWPTWDPYLGFGQPFLANPNTQVLYPWTWLTLWLPAFPGYTAYVVVHLFLAGLGVHVLARRWKLSEAAGLTAASLWMLSGPLVSLVSLWHHLAGAAWMPWVILAADRALEGPSARRALLWGAVAACQMLTGSADLTAMTWLLLGILALRFARPPALGAENRRRLGTFLAALLVAVGLAAVQWLPALDMLRASRRAELSEGFRTYWSLHPLNLAQSLLPVFTRDLPLLQEHSDRLFEGREPFLDSIYLGLAALPLVAASSFSRARRRALVFAALGLLIVVVALGKYAVLYDWVVGVIPPLRILRYPVKGLVVASFFWAMLAGLGVDALREGPRRRFGLVALVSGVAALAASGSGLLLKLRGEAVGPLVFRAAPDGTAFAAVLAPVVVKLLVAGLLAAAAAAVAFLADRGRLESVAIPLLTLLAAADLLSAHRDLSPTMSRALLEAPPPTLSAFPPSPPTRLYNFEYSMRVLGRLYARPSDADAFLPAPGGRLPPLAAKTLALQAYLPPWIASRWGLQGSFIPDLLGLLPRPARSLQSLLVAAEETPGFLRLLRVAGVTHVMALHDVGLESLVPVAEFPGFFVRPIRVFRVPEPLPRTYVVGQSRVLEGARSYTVLLDPGFDPAREIVLPHGPALVADPAFRGASALDDYRPDRVVIRAVLSHVGYVVLLDAYDPGWRARVDGQDTPVLRANTNFRAVLAGPGAHRVELWYDPPAIPLGLSLSAVTALLVALAALRLRRHGP